MPRLIVWRAAESGLELRGPEPQSGWGLFSAQGQEWGKASEVLRVQNLGRHLKTPEGECLFSCLTLVLAQSGLLLGGDPFLYLTWAEAAGCKDLQLHLALLLTKWEALS